MAGKSDLTKGVEHGAGQKVEHGTTCAGARPATNAVCPDALIVGRLLLENATPTSAPGA